MLSMSVVLWYCFVTTNTLYWLGTVCGLVRPVLSVFIELSVEGYTIGWHV